MINKELLISGELENKDAQRLEEVMVCGWGIGLEVF